MKLLKVWILLTLMVVSMSRLSAQGDTQVIIFLDNDSLTVYVPDADRASLAGMALAVDTGTERITRFLEEYPAFRGLPFSSLPTPICFRLLRNGSNAPAPTDCPSTRLLLQPLANADVFWFDSGTSQTRTIQVTRHSEILDFCPAGQSRCVITYVPPIESEPAASVEGHIAFVSDRDGNQEIYTMNPDGTDVQRLTNDRAMDTFPAWSPDGSKIAFVSDRTGETSVYVMDSDGSNVVRLIREIGNAWGRPAWSPDGRQIAFSFDSGDTTNIYVLNMDSESAGITQLTDGSVDGWPAWSPDGTHIVFVSTIDGQRIIYSMDLASKQKKALTSTGSDSYPVWSPDGAKIVFSSRRNDVWELYVMDSDGSNQQRLTYSQAVEWLPYWSPDSSKIVFYSSINNMGGIYVLEVASGNITALTENETNNFNPAWGM